MKLNRLFVAFSSTVIVMGCVRAPVGAGGDCTVNSDCNPGEACRDGICEVVCETDVDCPADQICKDSICEIGTRGNVPVITDVDGDGTEPCPDAQGNLCVVGGMQVTGAYLASASFVLRPGTGAGDLGLYLRAPPSDDHVVLDLPPTIVPGQYTLIATNSAGPAEQPLEFLQGVQGPQGTDGADGALDQAQVDAMYAAIDAAIPVGTVVPFAGSATSVPAGWLLCNGAELGRVDYASLFNVIGVSHGGGDGVGTFHLPDYRGRFLRGVDGASGRDPDAATRTGPQPANIANGIGNAGDAVGSVQGTATALPNSPWTTSDPGDHNHGNGDFIYLLQHSTIRTSETTDNTVGEPDILTMGAIQPNGAHTHTVAGGDNETRPKNAYVNWIIKF